MPLFFFNVNGAGLVYPDEVGSECADCSEARSRAVALARGVIAEEVEVGRLPLSARIEVEDAYRRPVFTLPFRLAVEER